MLLGRTVWSGLKQLAQPLINQTVMILDVLCRLSRLPCAFALADNFIYLTRELNGGHERRLMEDSQERIEHHARSSLRPTHAQNDRHRTEYEGLTLVQSRWPDAKGPKDNVSRHKDGRELVMLQHWATVGFGVGDYRERSAPASQALILEV